MTACSTLTGRTKTQIVEVPVAVVEPLPPELLKREPMPQPPAPDAIDPRTLRPTIKQSTLDGFVHALLFWAYGIDGQFRDIITAQPESTK